jgi:hypothetical protein
MKNLIVVGDLHGRQDLAQKVIDLAKVSDLQIISIGDLFHGKTPEVKLGVDVFDMLTAVDGFELILGNHETIFTQFLDAKALGMSDAEAVDFADHACRVSPDDDAKKQKVQRIMKEVKAEIEILGEERINYLRNCKYSKVVGKTGIYHAKPAQGIEACDSADEFWQSAIKGELILEHDNVLVGHEADFVIAHKKSVFTQVRGQVIGLDHGAKRGFGVGYAILDADGEILEIGSIY